MVKKSVKKVVKKPAKTVKATKKVVAKKPAAKVVKAVKKVAAKPEIEVITYSYDGRINRIIGQVGGVKKMIENKKDRMELLMQLKAARSAIKSLEAEVLQDHLQSLVGNLAGSSEQKNQKIAELKKIFVRSE